MQVEPRSEGLMSGLGRQPPPNDAMQLTGASHPRVPVTELNHSRARAHSRTGARS
jgi:hypothetical protein